MTDKQTADQYHKRQSFEAAGYQPRFDNGIRLHGPHETAKHAVLKTLVARELAKRRGPDGYDTEVKCPGGRVDVLDFGPPDEPPAVYEIETNASRTVKLAKADQYALGPVPPERVYFLDPTEAPDELDALVEWVERQVVG